MSVWKAAGRLDFCGYDGKQIQEGEPMQEFEFGPSKDRRKRCQQHAHGDVDWHAVDKSRHAQEAAWLQSNERPEIVRGFTPTDEPVPFDAKLAAAGERDE